MGKPVTLFPSPRESSLLRIFLASAIFIFSAVYSAPAAANCVLGSDTTNSCCSGNNPYFDSVRLKCYREATCTYSDAACAPSTCAQGGGYCGRYRDPNTGTITQQACFSNAACFVVYQVYGP